MDTQLLTSKLRTPAAVATSVGIISFAGGLAAGWYLRKRKETTVTEFEIEFDVEEVDDSQLVINFNEINADYAQPEYIEYKERPPVESDPDIVTVVVEAPEPTNIFRVDDNWNYAEESIGRTTKEIYILHADEFFADENGWDNQSTLTFYEGDGVLVDETDTPVHNAHLLIKEIRFGHGSCDGNIVYLRNEKMQTEYEVLRDGGSYEHEVLGVTDDAELRHHHRPGKFRLDE